MNVNMLLNKQGFPDQKCKRCVLGQCNNRNVLVQNPTVSTAI